MDAIILQILNGLDKGSAYALIALGLTLIFGTLGVVNFAHGALFMIGAFCAVTVQRLLGLSFDMIDDTQKDFLGNPLKVQVPYVESWFGHDLGAALIDWSVPLSILLAIPVMLLSGFAIERGLIKHFYKRPHAEQILVTFGLAIVLQEVVKFFFGANPIQTPAPAVFPGSFDFGALIGFGQGTIIYPYWRMVYFLFAAAVIGGRLRLSAVHHLRHCRARRHGRSRDRWTDRHQHRPPLHDHVCPRRSGRGRRRCDVRADRLAELSHGHGLPCPVFRRRGGRRHGLAARRRCSPASCSASCSPLPP